MILHTPRRRISPRTRNKYRAIREFFRRALCSSSQQEIKISSSIALNVTELKRKITGLESQLDEVSRHCHMVSSLDISSIKDSSKSTRQVFSSENVISDRIEPTTGQIERSLEPNMNSDKTKQGYEKRHNKNISECNLRSQQPFKENSHNKMINDKINRVPKSKSAKLCRPKAKSTFETLNNTKSTSSFRSYTFPKKNTNAGYTGHYHKEKLRDDQYGDHSYPRNKRKHTKSVVKCQTENIQGSLEARPINSRKHNTNNKLDTDFIEDIIRRQYKPVRMFGNRGSDASQISVPVCRDQHYSVRENVIRGTELSSCCYDQYEMWSPSHARDVRSMCDTHVYRAMDPQQHRINKNHYNYSDLYDLIPVKEKSSPKMHKKFIDENVLPSASYREVPPSPRTLRPRLNLTAQYKTDSEHNQNPPRRVLPKRLPNHRTYAQDTQSDITSTTASVRKDLQMVNKKIQARPRKLKHEASKVSSLQHETSKQGSSTTTFESNVNKTRDADPSVDKTDKALYEIKAILQSFLQEIKKETTGQTDKSRTSLKNTETENVRENTGQTTTNNHEHHQPTVVNGYNVGRVPPPYIPPPAFPNPCCYPVMPICPLNCSMQNGLMRPNQSFTFAKDTQTEQNDKPLNTDVTCNVNTDELLKEIYKHLAQKKFDQNYNASEAKEDKANKIDDMRVQNGGAGYLTSNNKVSTPPLRCVSQSCEAIGSYRMSEKHYGCNTARYSDTVIDRLAFGTTPSETEYCSKETNKSSENKKTKPNKFRKVLNIFGLFKKKKHVSIDVNEVNESSNTVAGDIPPEALYHQNITNYMMHGQKYFQPPPVPPFCQQPHINPNHHPYSQPLHEYSPLDIYGHIPYQPEYGPIPRYQTDPRYFHDHQSSTQPSHSTCECCMHQQPQVCLKEIQLRSTGTQSEKMPLFRMTKKKNSTSRTSVSVRQTAQTPAPKPLSPLLTKWRNLKEKAMEDLRNNPREAMNFSLKRQKELTEGDMKMKNVVLKKLFKTKMPLSPRNMLMKSLLRKQQAVFDDPYNILKQRNNMFV